MAKKKKNEKYYESMLVRCKISKALLGKFDKWWKEKRHFNTRAEGVREAMRIALKN